MGQCRGCTLWRPWPACFLLRERAGRPGPKRVENRDWYPQWACLPMVGGIALADPAVGLWLALHAGRTADEDALQDIREEGFSELQMGSPALIVGVARLARVLDLDVLGHSHPAIRRHDPWAVGRYCWEVDRVRELPAPVACRGAQGLWRLPELVLEQVRRQWRTGQ